jgi:hypothetical protein
LSLAQWKEVMIGEGKVTGTNPVRATVSFVRRNLMVPLREDFCNLFKLIVPPLGEALFRVGV